MFAHGRSLKNFNESGMKKVSVGAKVLLDSVAVEGSIEGLSQRLSGSCVYGVCINMCELVSTETF